MLRKMLAGGSWQEAFGRRHLAGGSWQEAVGRRQLAGGSWQDAVGRMQLAVGSRLNIAVAFKQLKQLAVRSSK